MTSTDFLLLLPELLLAVGAMALLMVAAFAGDRQAGMVNALAALLLAFAVVAVSAVGGGDGHTAFNDMVRVDAFAAYSKYLVFGSAIVALLMAPRFFAAEGYRAEYPVLVLLACVGMALMVGANDLMTLYLGLELNSLAAYVLASFSRRDARSSEAGLKYFVLGSLASGILLYGMALIYGFTGSTAFASIGNAVTGDMGIGLLFGVVFTLVGLAFKISAVPFHMWTPDVYEGAPTPVTAFFATAPKVAAVALLVRVCVEAMPQGADAWRQVIAFMSIASMVLGAVAGIGQRNIKRLLAYSSIANVGFILMGLAAATVQGVTAVLFYLTVYVVMTLGAFLAVAQLRDADGRMVEDIPALAGLWKTRPGLAAAIAILMFSLAGIPPLFGFWPKLMVFEAAVEANMWPLAAIGAVASVVAAFYYLRIIKVMLFDPPADVTFPVTDGVVERGLIAVSAAYVGVFGFVLIAPLGAVAARAAGSLL